jgi:folate-binding protein YgfZ
MKFTLNDRSLIRVSGTDAKSFLQGQLSNDIDAIKSSQVQINAYCQHQGKVIAVLWVINSGNEYLISLPMELLDIVKSRLEMFVMMSEVEISDLTATTPHFGVIDEDLKGSISLNDRQSIFIGEMPANDIVEIDDNEWQRVCIETGIPEVYLSTTEKFVPQMLNLDIDEIGVSFSKGCYPGQEVVARLHYLGKAKRRMFKFKGLNLSVGNELIVDGSSSLRASGMVNRCAKSDDEYICLATLESTHKDDKISLNDGTKIVRIVDE